MLKIAVLGGRGMADAQTMAQYVDRLIVAYADNDVTIVTGSSPGAETLAATYAGNRGYTLETIPVEWETHGVQAERLRNEALLDAADILVYFEDGKREGLYACVEAMNKGMDVHTRSTF